jgi:hypothetical protein
MADRRVNGAIEDMGALPSDDQGRKVRLNTAEANKLAKSSLDHNWRSAGYFRASKMTFARTILALVTALSVAVLPAAGGAAVNSKSYHATEMTAGPMD